MNNVCNKCGNTVEKTDKKWNFNLGVGDYGSLMDGMRLKFHLCDRCFYEYIDSFAIPVPNNMAHVEELQAAYAEYFDLKNTTGENNG